MSIGNIVLGTDCTWNDKYLSILKTGFAMSENAFNPAEDGSFSVSICCRLNSINVRVPIIGQCTSYSSNGTQDRFSIYTYGGKVYNALGKYSYNKTISGGSVVAGGTYVIDMTVDGTNKLLSLYINGQFITNISIADYVYYESPHKVSLNSFNNSGAVTNTNGCDIDYYAINIYNKALSAAEIEQNYNTYVSRFGLQT